MKSLLPLVSFALLAQVFACNIASSNSLPKINVIHGSTVRTMLVLAGQVSNGYKFTAPDGSYTIKFPGKPSGQSQNVQTALGPMSVLIETYQSSDGKRAYFASSSQIKIDPRKYNVEKGLNGARNGIVKSTGATVNSEKKINYKGASGREMNLTTKQGKMKVRIYVTNFGKGPTVYQTFVMDANGNADDAAVNSFLDSLTFKAK